MDKLKVFLSSPSDLSSDKECLKNSLTKLSKHTESTYGVQIISLTGDDAERGPDRPQGLINKLLIQCDVFIGLMGKFFGSPTGIDDSGTHEEFRFMVNKYETEQRPQVRMFFKEINKSDLKTEEMDQYNKVKEFKENITNNFYYDPYKKIDDIIEVIHKEIRKFIACLPEITEFRVSKNQVEREGEITLYYSANEAELPLKLERFYMDGTYNTKYNLNFLTNHWTDKCVIKNSIYKLTVSNKFGKRSKECVVNVLGERGKTNTTPKEKITSLIEETRKNLLESNETMKETECIRNATILFDRIRDHLIDIDNNSDDYAPFIIEKISGNKYINNPNSLKIVASHFTVIRSNIYENKVIITYKMGIRKSICYLYRAIFKYREGARPPWIIENDWEEVLSFDPSSSQKKTIIDESFLDSIQVGLKVIRDDILKQE